MSNNFPVVNVNYQQGVVGQHIWLFRLFTLLVVIFIDFGLLKLHNYLKKRSVNKFISVLPLLIAVLLSIETVLYLLVSFIL